jgi:hypothetical protein
MNLLLNQVLGPSTSKQRKKTQPSMNSFVGSAPTKPATQNQKESKSVSSMLCKAPEDVVAERHKCRNSQSTIEHCTKKGKERKQDKELMIILSISYMRTEYYCML